MTPKVPGSIPGVYISFLLHSFFCAKFCPKQISPACTKKLHQHSSMCQVLSETNFPCISTSNSPCECTKKLHQTLPVNVRKNYISFFRKRCRARYGRPSAGLRARRPSAAWRARRVGINLSYLNWPGNSEPSTFKVQKKLP